MISAGDPNPRLTLSLTPIVAFDGNVVVDSTLDDFDLVAFKDRHGAGQRWSHRLRRRQAQRWSQGSRRGQRMITIDIFL